MKQENRILGGLYGSLVGDALGVPVEFASREKRKLDPVIGMRSQGAHGQPAGTWSDDGSLLLSSAESLIEKGFDLQDMGERFLQWFELAHWAAHGLVFDIGNATRQALLRIRHGIPAIEAGGRDQYDNGNGSLMRILPVVLANLRTDDQVFVPNIEKASAITHAHPRSKMACVFFGLMVRALFDKIGKEDALRQTQACFAGLYERSSEFSFFSVVTRDGLISLPEESIKSDGYVINTLAASIWSLLTTDSFADCVLKAVNLGDDTDTTGCVAGGLAGVLYGLDAIPIEWRLALPRQQDLRELLAKFVETSVTKP